MFWILHGHVHDRGEWPPARIDGPYDDEGLALAACHPLRRDGRLLPAAIVAAYERPERPDMVAGIAAVLDPEEA